MDEMDDIQNLLDKLDDKSPEVAQIEQPIQSGIITEVVVSADPDVLPPDLVQQNSLQHLVKAITEHEATTSEVLNSCRSDRTEAQEAIDMCKQEISKILNSGAAKDVPRVFVETLVKAIEVKAGIMTNVVKIMDSRAKLISSIKGQPIINNNTNINIDSDKSLEDILEEPFESSSEVD